jgi:hypothetical protein
MRAVQMLLSPSALASAPAVGRRAAIVVPVLLLHIALLWLLTQAHPERAGVASALAAKPMVMRWIEAVTSVPPLPPAAVKPAPEIAQTQPPRITSKAVIQSAPISTSAAPPSEAVVAPTTTDVAPAPTATSPPLVGPLDLTLRRSASSVPLTRSPASLATQDSRANSERASFGEKLAQDLGSDSRSTEENLGDGRIRFRSGADCVIVHESRAGQLDPMSQTTRPAPRGVKACK